jgi:hypothetical protein
MLLKGKNSPLIESKRILEDLKGYYHLDGYYTDSGLAYNSRKRRRDQIGVIETQQDRIHLLGDWRHNPLPQTAILGYHDRELKHTYLYLVNPNRLLTFKGGRLLDSTLPSFNLSGMTMFLSYCRNLNTN